MRVVGVVWRVIGVAWGGLRVVGMAWVDHIESFESIENIVDVDSIIF